MSRKVGNTLETKSGGTAMWNWISRRSLLKAAAWSALPPFVSAGVAFRPEAARAGSNAPGASVEYLPVTLDVVPFPRNISFTANMPGKEPVTLSGHYWYNAPALAANTRCPAILELNPYRCRDGTMYVDSKMHPWFAYSGYLSFRVDLQGSGNSTGSLTDEYTEEELSYCVQVIQQIANLPICDGNVGMIGESWSAVNSLMVAAREDCPSALKAVVVNCGSDDRYNDDVHYMGGAMMMDNVGWASSMWGWLPAPPDPAVVGDSWRENWRQRIRNMSFWFQQWGTHQTRDEYWSRTSVRDHYDKVKVPVFIMSGWEDGYKNPVDHVLRGLGGLGKPVAAMLGPYGHRYPFDGYPGPRVDWLRYVVDNWWDKWLRGKEPDPAKLWPELTLWLGNSREPESSPDFEDSGTWVAEDHDWMKRTKEKHFFLAPNGSLLAEPPTAASSSTASVALAAAGTPLTMGTSMLETSSFGNSGNPDLPGDQTPDDNLSITFDSASLSQDLACYGYPVVKLNLTCDKPIAALVVRLTEVSPTSGKSHLVSYSFFNLVYREGDQAKPQPVEPRLFAVEVPLNIIGHVFKQGWKIRLAVSPVYFPTLWGAPEVPRIELFAGPAEGKSPAVLILPGRDARLEDEGLNARLPPHTAYVDPELYVPTLETIRPGSNQRLVERVDVDGSPGTVVRKTFDSGRTVFGGALDNLLVDVKASENFQILDGQPLSQTGFTRYETTLQRSDWIVQVVTSTRVWSEKQSSDGGVVFKYQANVQGFTDGELFEEAQVEGTIPRLWV
ncbi:CocE/NonD family hydrolase [Aestuariivirga sp.]|uniref:CocE/NonD family hydrolase n=1 Tax=Aestuariivirga sp. TaxID=2650926 RepID=UPI003BA8AE84